MTFFNQYMVLTYLARGNFGKVYLCLNTADHRLYAVKVGSVVHIIPTRHGDSTRRYRTAVTMQREFAIESLDRAKLTPSPDACFRPS